MPRPTAHAEPGDLDQVEHLLEHFSTLEAQFQQIREGLTHSHRLSTLGTIATIIAHEYNNILTPVISYAQLAQAKPDDAALQRKAVEKALAGAQRAAHISSSLLGFAREQDGERAAPLKQVIEESLACLGRHPSRDGIELVIDVPGVDVAMNPLNLQQVFVNLILNARKAMRRTGGRLTIRGRVEGGRVHLEVADTGPGVPPQILDRLFEPFVTHTPDRDGPEDQKGTGLGLCICRDLCRNAGGSIEVASEPGAGATFHIVLPCAEDLLTT